MAISSFVRQKAKGRPIIKGIEKDSSGITTRNIMYTDTVSNIENTASNRQTYPGSFDYTAYSDATDSGDFFNGIQKYYNTTIETSTWFRDTGSETT
jgi:hypothetical protein